MFNKASPGNTSIIYLLASSFLTISSISVPQGGVSFRGKTNEEFHDYLFIKPNSSFHLSEPREFLERPFPNFRQTLVERGVHLDTMGYHIYQ